MKAKGGDCRNSAGFGKTGYIAIRLFVKKKNKKKVMFIDVNVF